MGIEGAKYRLETDAAKLYRFMERISVADDHALELWATHDGELVQYRRALLVQADSPSFDRKRLDEIQAKLKL